MDFLKNYLRAALSVPVAVLVLVVRIFRINRDWLTRQLSRKHVSMAVKGFFILTMLGWFVIWMVAKDEYRDNLNRAVKSWWSEAKQ